jgi:hypothetical protein
MLNRERIHQLLKQFCFHFKIDGKSPTIKDRNDAVMLRINIGLQKLIDIAAQRRRNYIIDHVSRSNLFSLCCL